MISALLDPVQTQKRTACTEYPPDAILYMDRSLLNFLRIGIKQQKEAALPAVL